MSRSLASRSLASRSLTTGLMARVAAIAAALAAPLVVVPHAPAAASATVKPALKASTTVAAPGTLLVFKGQLPASTPRKVLLQSSTGKGWSKVAAAATTRNGKFVLRTLLTPPPGSASIQFRVSAPGFSLRGKTFRARRTPARTIVIKWPVVQPSVSPDPSPTVEPTAAPDPNPAVEPTLAPAPSPVGG